MQLVKDIAPSSQLHQLDSFELFPFVLWHIWLNRNRNVFNNQKNYLTIDIVKMRAFEYKQFSSPLKFSTDKKEIQIKWIPPPSGHYKLDTDGAYLIKE